MAHEWARKAARRNAELRFSGAEAVFSCASQSEPSIAFGASGKADLVPGGD